MNFEGNSLARSLGPAGYLTGWGPSAALIDQPPAGSPRRLNEDALVTEPIPERDRQAVEDVGARAMVGAACAEIGSKSRPRHEKAQSDHDQRCQPAFVKHEQFLDRWAAMKSLKTRAFTRIGRIGRRLPYERVTDISAATSTSR